MVHVANHNVPGVPHLALYVVRTLVLPHVPNLKVISSHIPMLPGC